MIIISRYLSVPPDYAEEISTMIMTRTLAKLISAQAYPNPMWTGIELLFILQNIRLTMPDALNQFFITISATEMQYFIPVLLMALLLWFVGTWEAELVMFNFGFSNLVGYLTKNIVQQPRPWNLDPGLQPDSESRRGAPGYSLPSGHTTSSVSTFGTLAWLYRDDSPLLVLFVSLGVLIPFSRMYLTVHTPIDIIVAIVITVVVCIVNYKILKWSHESDRNRTCALLGYFAAAVILSLVCDAFAGKMLSNKMTGLCIAMPVCLLVKERFISYEVPTIPIRDIIIRALPGMIACIVIMEVPYRLFGSIGTIFGLAAAMAFITLVYPLVLNRWNGSGRTEVAAN